MVQPSLLVVLTPFITRYTWDNQPWLKAPTSDRCGRPPSASFFLIAGWIAAGHRAVILHWWPRDYTTKADGADSVYQQSVFWKTIILILITICNTHLIKLYWFNQKLITIIWPNCAVSVQSFDTHFGKKFDSAHCRCWILQHCLQIPRGTQV